MTAEARAYNPLVTARVFAPDAEASGQVLALSRDEAAHVGRVLRLRVGDTVRVFDGRGREWTAAIAAASAGRMSVALGAAGDAGAGDAGPLHAGGGGPEGRRHR